MGKIIDSLRRNFQNIYWWRDNILYFFLKLFDRGGGVRVLEEDWDSLIILDCCRYDFFEMVYEERGMKGDLKLIESIGTWTVEFLKENFRNRCDDIVYVTANPYVDKYLEGKFYKIVPVWKYGWSKKYNTVPPWEVYSYALKTLKRYGDRRLIVHFIQPHHPYLTLNCKDELLDKIRRSVLYDEKSRRATGKSLTEIYSTDIYIKYSSDRIKDAYLENLRIVMPYVESLLNTLPGTTVVTSDHGESFGDRIHPLIPIRFYGHGFTRLKSLIEVPWLTVEEHLKDPYRDPKELRKEMTFVERRFGCERTRIRSILRRRFGCFTV